MASDMLVAIHMYGTSTVYMMTFVLQDGWSPLMMASDQGHLEVVKMLINAGAYVNHANEVVLAICNCDTVHVPLNMYCSEMLIFARSLLY